MIMRAATLCFLLVGSAAAETLVATRTIRAATVISATDVRLIQQTVPGAFAEVESVLGMEARVILYAGRPILPGQVGPPALVERNQVVPMVFNRGGLTITTDARVLDRAGSGDWVRAMNLSSRTTVGGWVRSDGTIIVGGGDQ